MWGNDERIHSKQWKVPFENKDIYQESFGDLKFPTSHSYLECLTWGRLIWFILIWFDLVWFDLVWFVLIWFVVVSNFLNASSGAGGWLGEVGVFRMMMFELPGSSPVPLSHQGEAKLSQEHTWASRKLSPEKESSSIGSQRCKGSQATPLRAKSLQKLSFPELLRHL